MSHALDFLSGLSPWLQAASAVSAAGIAWRVARLPLRILGKAWRPIEDGESPGTKERAGARLEQGQEQRGKQTRLREQESMGSAAPRSPRLFISPSQGKIRYVDKHPEQHPKRGD